MTGIDLIHNPEFTTCEFYQAFANLEDLIRLTEAMLAGLHTHLCGTMASDASILHQSMTEFKGPYKRIDFIPHLEATLGKSLPDLRQPCARKQLQALLEDRKIEVAESTSLPKLLDRLSSLFIEPDCKEPTFIINHPECLSPLAKSFSHPDCGQEVAARAELFVNGQELINMYEEENSPVKQRRKFEDQVGFKDHEHSSGLDEAYLEALEWGLPPTGGWGGGIERLCMVMTGAARIGDVTSFGTLRNVVALGSSGKSES